MSAEVSALVRVQHSTESTCPITLRRLVHYYSSLRSSENVADSLTFRITADDAMERLRYGEWAEVEGGMEKGTGVAAFTVLADLLRPIRDASDPQSRAEMTIEGRVTHLINSPEDLLVVEVSKPTGVLYFGLGTSDISPGDLEFMDTDQIAQIQGKFGSLHFHPSHDGPLLRVAPLIEPTFTLPTTGSEIIAENMHSGLVQKETQGSGHDNSAVSPEPLRNNSITQLKVQRKDEPPALDSPCHPTFLAAPGSAPATSAPDGPSAILPPVTNWNTEKSPTGLAFIPRRVFAWVSGSRMWGLNTQVGCGDLDLATDGDVDGESGPDSPPPENRADAYGGLRLDDGDLGLLPTNHSISYRRPSIELPGPPEECFSEQSRQTNDTSINASSGDIDHTPTQLCRPLSEGEEQQNALVADPPVEECFSEATGRTDEGPSNSSSPDGDRTPTQQHLLLDGGDEQKGNPIIEAHIEEYFSEVSVRTNRTTKPSSRDRDRTPTQQHRPLADGDEKDNHIATDALVEECFSEASTHPIEELGIEALYSGADEGRTNTTDSRHGDWTPTQPGPRRPLFIPEDETRSGGKPGYDSASPISSFEEALSGGTSEDTPSYGGGNLGRNSRRSSLPSKRWMPYNDDRIGSPKQRRRQSD